MEAMDQLLMACHSQHLNLYVESYLKTVQKLLESPMPDMQTRASESFLQFAQKEVFIIFIFCFQLFQHLCPYIQQKRLFY